MPTRPRTGPRPRDAEATRAALLRAATETFAEAGFAGARVDAIAERAGVNKRMIYAYFRDKAGLYREVLASRFRGAAEVSRGVAAGRGPRAALEALVRWYFEVLARDPPFARLLAWEMLSGGARGHDILIESATPALDVFAGLVRRGIDAGAFRRDLDPELLRAAVTSVTIGYFLQRGVARGRVQDRAWNPARFLDHACRLLFDGIAAPGGRR
ncbi:TetR/AcrR family transcriptional regulator [Anaeromyxobacter paludicola]|uniref:HTH tetR-type domain-containing protein n=1 Tax=Anaeromyxobacter paludicola TaxID=2918171 RepID=A0ABM7XB79_9BACT|nr:TetR family transcriptional regulator [Anaeromyxobacter paludicola]BDG09119.1 hypothetical protein AMPC_22320 [Anaeromyxobacter paludicola]